MQKCYYKKYISKNFIVPIDKRKQFLYDKPLIINKSPLWYSKKYKKDINDCFYNESQIGIFLDNINSNLYIFSVFGTKYEYLGNDTFNFILVWNKIHNTYIFIDKQNNQKYKYINGINGLFNLTEEDFMQFFFKNIPEYDDNLLDNFYL
jgi:hypothetical protein